MQYDRKELKELAKAKVQTANAAPWKMAMLICMVQMALSMLQDVTTLSGVMQQLSDGVRRSGSVVAVALCAALTLALGVLISVMSSGFACYCLRVCRGRSDPGDEMFTGGRKLRAIVCGALLVDLWVVLWVLLFGGLAAGAVWLSGLLPAAVRTRGEAFLLLLIILVGGVGLCRLVLRYAMTPYIIMDRERIGVMQALRESRRVMEGNLARLFQLYLSFLGWWALLVGLQLVVPLVVVDLGLIRLDLNLSALEAIGPASLLWVAPYLLLGLLLGWMLSLWPDAWVTAYVGISLAGFYCDLLQGAPDDRPAVPARGEQREEEPVSYSFIDSAQLRNFLRSDRRTWDDQDRSA